MPSVLIIDDNANNRETYADLLTDDGHTCLTAASGEDGLATLNAAAVDAVLCDLKLPHLDGLETMSLAHERHGPIPWVLITGYGSEEIAVAAIKQGAFNYLTKPVDMPRLKATMASAVRTAGISRENRALRRELGYEEALQRIVGSSTAIKQLKTVIRQVAGHDASVLIEGESGTGKELVADAIHALSDRSGRPLIKINMGAIPRELLESEMFGHERGAFTNAFTQKKGKFESADTGTIFLDEIGEMPMDSQVKLLRVLQNGSFTRVGGNDVITTDVRIICASNRHLKHEVLAGNFRMDLYYRLNVVHIRVPALRERREDIPLLAQYFIEHLNGRHQGGKHLSDELLAQLARLDWPGNVRELENLLERLYVLSSGNLIEGGNLLTEHSGIVEPPARPHPVTRSVTDTPMPDPVSPPDGAEAIHTLVGLPMDEVERRLIVATLQHCNGNKSKAARLLQIGLKTLYRKIERYRL
jgi:two-component system response regulator HydG